MNIKISTLKSSLQHSSSFSDENQAFLNSLEEELGSKITIAPLEDYDCDIKLIFIQTGGSEGLFLKNYSYLKEPYYLLTSGGNNSLAASLEIMTYLSLNNKKGEILHGSSRYLAERIKKLAIISKAKEELASTTLGLLGKPSDWLIASVPNFEKLNQKFGIKIKEIPLSMVEKKYNEMSFTDGVSEYKTDFDKKEINGALTVYKALKKVSVENDLDGLSIRCFDLLTSIKRTGCLALSKLNDEGITATCEGDVMTMVSMHIVKAITGQASFQANPSRIDVENNEIVFAHCTLPLSMTTSYRFDTHFESGIGVAIKGELKPSKVTIFRLSADLTHYTVMTGVVLSNMDDKNLCRTQIKVHLDSDVSKFLTNPSGNHHVIFYGDHKESIESLLNELL